MPGPPRTPTRILEMRGSWRAAARRAAEPAAPIGPVEPAVELTDDERSIWRQSIDPLVAAGVVATVDRHIATRFVLAFAQWRRDAATVRAHGPDEPKRDADGRVVGVRERPSVRRMARLERSIRAIEAELGLTPRSRVRLGLPVDGELSAHGGASAEDDIFGLD